MDRDYEELDDDIETLEEPIEEYSPEESSDYVPNEEYYDGEPQKKFGQEEFERTLNNKNHYKQEREEKERNLEKAAKQREDAQQAKNQKYTKKNPNDKTPYKADGSDTRDKTRQEKRNDRKNLREAKRNEEEAKRQLRKSKLDNAKNKLYQIKNPREAMKSRMKNAIKNKTKNTAKHAGNVVKEGAKKAAQTTANVVKEGAKKAGQAVAKVSQALIEKIIAFFASNPYVLLVLVIIIAILALIILVVVIFSDSNDFGTGSGITSAKVEYNINGINSDTKIEIVSGDVTTGEYNIVTTISMEKYIAGVALYEMGEDYNEEAMKAHIIAVRSNLLTMTKNSSGLGIDTSENVIRVKSNDANHVYWDYNTDLYRTEDVDNPGTYIYSPEYVPIEEEMPYKLALTSEAKQKYETVVSSVMGMYAVDSSGNAININYDTTTIDSIKNLAITNAGTENGNYNALLMKTYSNVSEVKKAESIQMIYYGEVGEFSTWKQKTSMGAPWGEIKLGSSDKTTINKVGCLVTSISMQIAYSGVDTSPITDFNPGTFATAMKNNGCFSNGGAINSYACMGKTVPNFQYAGRIYLSGNNNERYQKIREYAEKGYFIVIEVRKHAGGQHWVSLDVQNSAASNWEDIYMWDPASTKTKIKDKWSYKANEFVYFKANK